MAAERDRRVVVLDHPLVSDRLGRMRDARTPHYHFRQLVMDLGMLLAYEALRDIPQQVEEIETPLEPCQVSRVDATRVYVVPVLRAGLGLAEGVLELVPEACIGHIGLMRDEATHEPRRYLTKLPAGCAESICLICDPMVATGGSLVEACRLMREHGARDLRVLSILCAPEGLERVLSADPDVVVYTCAIDRELDENAYIRPGLGDAGDRIFGTVDPC